MATNGTDRSSTRSSSPVALVTGGASGIGLGVVKRLLELNYNVSIVDFNEIAGAEIAKRLGSKTFFAKANVAVYEEQAAAFAATFAKWGRIDFVYANAGIGDRVDFYAPAQAFLENGAPVKPDTLVVDICLNGCMWAAYLALHYFRSNPDGVGKIAMTSSICGIYMSNNVPLYTAAKYGIVGLARAMGQGLKAAGVPVTVNCVCPGLVATPLAGALAQVCPAEVLTPISTVVKAIEGFLNDGGVTGQVAECSVENVYYRPMHEYSDKAAEFIMSSAEDSLLGSLKGKNIVELIKNAKAQGEMPPAGGGPEKIKQRQ